jgi:hypothetical protein
MCFSDKFIAKKSDGKGSLADEPVEEGKHFNHHVFREAE